MSLYHLHSEGFAPSAPVRLRARPRYGIDLVLQSVDAMASLFLSGRTSEMPMRSQRRHVEPDDTNDTEAVRREINVSPINIRPGRRRPPTGDAGLTLVEILITIVLMGTVVVGILTATRTLIMASQTSDDVAQVQTALLTAAERIDRAPREVYRCVFDDPIRAAAQLELGVDVDVVDNYWSVKYEHLGPAGWADGACPATGYQQHLVQRITITMQIPETDVQRSLTVVRSDV